MKKKGIFIVIPMSIALLTSSSVANLTKTINENTNYNTLLDYRFDVDIENEITIKSTIENHDEKVLSNSENQMTMAQIYDLLTEGTINEAVNKKFIEYYIEALLDLENNVTLKNKYNQKIENKLLSMTKYDNYIHNNQFDEDLFRLSLSIKGYKVTNKSSATKHSIESLSYDYDDYINKVLRYDVLVDMLKEKYILDRKGIDIFRIKDVEYFTVSSSIDNEYEDLSVRDFVRSIRDRIANGEDVNFNNIEKELHDEIKLHIDEEYKKIGTDKDYSKSIERRYTNGFTQVKELGYNQMLKEVDNKEYAFTKMISSHSENDAVISQSITSRLLSISDPTSTDFDRRVYKIGDYYYLVNANAGTTIDASDILLSEISDSSTYVYSIVRFNIINNESENKKSEAIELIASQINCGDQAFRYYISNNTQDILIHSTSLIEYFKSTYPELFMEGE